jgi:hypothetical protein
MATDIEKVRQKIGDRRVVHRKEAVGDGATTFFQLDPYPVEDLTVWVDGVISVAYTLDAANGLVEFTAAPAANLALVFQYYAVIWTDTEIQDFLTDNGSNVNISSAMMLLAWAADAARLAKRETRSGGGGLGAYTVDTSVAARELRNTAETYLEYEREYGAMTGTHVPAEGLTEVPWTEAAASDRNYQRIIRES